MGKIFDALEKAGNESGKSKIQQKTAPVLPLSVKEEKKRVTETEKSLEVNPIGNNYDVNLITLRDPESFEASQFKVLRTNLLFSNDERSPRTILITSAIPGEGKSFVCANLAVSIAQGMDEHVLIMDCDMRKGCIHKIFGFQNIDAGLNEYILDNVPLPSILLKTGVNKLTLLPCGRPVKNPSEILSSKKMAALIEETRQRYDDRYVLIDSAPPGLAPETIAIAKYVDAIIVVVRVGVTKRDLLSETVDMLGKDRIIGVVANRMDMTSVGGYAYGKYRDYHKYYAHYYK